MAIEIIEKEQRSTETLGVEESFRQCLESVEAFKAKHGRAPKVLHVGNIANNAYLNAKLLNEIGYDSDVICYDYYHIMGCPEWEEVDFDGVIKDHFYPDWHSVNLKGYKRPKWFAQAPFRLCAKYLIAKQQKKTLKAWFYWHQLEFKRSLICSDILNYWRPKFKAFTDFLLSTVGPENKYTTDGSTFLSKLYPFDTFIYYSVSVVTSLVLFSYHLLKELLTVHRWKPIRTIKKYLICFVLNTLKLLFSVLLLPIHILTLPFHLLHSKTKRASQSLSLSLPIDSSSEKEKHLSAFQKLQRDFVQIFPERQDRLGNDDFTGYTHSGLSLWTKLFSYYDIIHGYSTDPIYPMLSGNKPFVAYEHGTIREIPFENNGVARLTSLAYAKASSIIVTNADNLEKARALQSDHSKIICGLHRFDDRKIMTVIDSLGSLSKHTGRFGFSSSVKVFLAPARQHHSIKGNLNIVEAAHLIHQRYPGQFVVVFTEWGEEVDFTKKLIHDLGLDAYFHWVAPLGKKDLYNAYRCVDCVMDQFVLPCIGGLCIDTMVVAGCPVITYLDDEMMAEFYGETIPLFNAHSPMGIAEAMETVITQPDVCTQKTLDCKKWMDDHHSYKSVLIKLTDAYRLTEVIE